MVDIRVRVVTVNSDSDATCVVHDMDVFLFQGSVKFRAARMFEG
jgi:hypothetical protein